MFPELANYKLFINKQFNLIDFQSSALLHSYLLQRSSKTVQNTSGIHFLRGPSVASLHFVSLLLDPQNDVPSISFSTIETGKSPLVLESFSRAFFSIPSVSRGFLEQNTEFDVCSLLQRRYCKIRRMKILLRQE
ncbi:von Willebrand factor [Trichonephila clavipes]|nr:von Willebrand factor [Trichonephila clavipes]